MLEKSGQLGPVRLVRLGQPGCGDICRLLFPEKHITGVERRRCQIVLGLKRSLA